MAFGFSLGNGISTNTKSNSKKAKTFGFNLSKKKEEKLTIQPEPQAGGLLTREVGLPEHLGGGRYLTNDKGELILSRRSQDALPVSPEAERDHIFSVALGGVSTKENLQYLPETKEGRQAGKVTVEKQAIDDYKAGKLSLGEARLKVATKNQQIRGLSPTEEEQTVKGQLKKMFNNAFVKPFTKEGRSEADQKLKESQARIAETEEAIKQEDIVKEAEEKKLTTTQKLQKDNPMFQRMAKTASEVTGREIKPENVYEEMGGIPQEQRDLINAIEVENLAEGLAKVATAPIRSTIGMLARDYAMIEDEFKNYNEIYTPRTDVEKLFLGEEPIQKLSESKDLYGIIARNAGIGTAITAMVLLDNPFMVGTGKPVKTAVSRGIEAKMAQYLVESGAIPAVQRKIAEAEIRKLAKEGLEMTAEEISEGATERLAQIKSKSILSAADEKEIKFLTDNTSNPQKIAKEYGIKLKTEGTELGATPATGKFGFGVKATEEAKVAPKFTEDIKIEPSATNKKVERQKQIAYEFLSDEERAAYSEFKARSATDFDEFKSNFDNLKEKHKVDVWDANRKSDGRAIEKAYDDYSLDFNRIGDMSRGAYIVDDFKKVNPLLADIKSSFKIAKVKNRFEANNYGYRDILVSVEMPNGTRAEIQIMTPEMAKLKKQYHDLYEETRVLESKKRTANLTEPELIKYKKLVKEQQEAYGKAWEKDKKLGFDKVRAELMAESKRPALPPQFKLDRLSRLAEQAKKGGGETLDLKTGESLTGKRVFAVSPYPERSLVFRPGEMINGKAVDLNGKSLYEYARKNIDLLEKPNHYLGLWYDKKSKQWYIDVVVTTKSKAKATMIGRKGNQISIADLGKIKTEPKKAIISTGGTGKAVASANIKKKAREIEEIIAGERKTSKLYERTRETLKNEFSADPEYKVLTHETDARRAVSLIKKDKEKAMRIARGLEAAPAGQTDTAITIALAHKAGQEGNYKLQSDLIRGLSLRRTKSGQEIEALKGMVGGSPEKYMRRLIQKRLDALRVSEITDKGLISRPKTGRALPKKIETGRERIKSLIKSKSFDIKKAQEFIDSLACKT